MTVSVNEKLRTEAQQEPGEEAAKEPQPVVPRRRKSGKHAKLHNPNPLADMSFSFGRF